MYETLGLDYWGYALQVDSSLPEKKKQQLRYELVEKSFLDKGVEINNWYKVNTNLYGDFVWVEAETRDLAVSKYIKRINKINIEEQ